MASEGTRTSKGGAKPWAAPDQLEYLHSRTVTYNEIKAMGSQTGKKKKLTDFWVEVFEHWQETWPFPPLTETEISEKVTDASRIDTLKAVSILHIYKIHFAYYPYFTANKVVVQ
jgi:hypothetical protein